MRIHRRKFVEAIFGVVLRWSEAKSQNRSENFLQDVRQNFQVPALAAACNLGDKRVDRGESVSGGDAFHKQKVNQGFCRRKVSRGFTKTVTDKATLWVGR